MGSSGSFSNETLLVTAAVVSIQIARQLSAEEVEQLAAFFEVLGDNLALLALNAPSNTSSSSDSSNSSTKEGTSPQLPV